jgi:Rrf2 family protein
LKHGAPEGSRYVEVTRRTDYAIRLLVALAQKPDGSYVSATELAATQQVPRAVARSILSALSRSGLVVGRKGAGGGMGLGAPPDRISLLSVVEAVEGPITFSLCTTDPEYCGYAEECSMHRVWRDAENLVRGFLASHTLADLGAEVGAMTMRPRSLPEPLGDAAHRPKERRAHEDGYAE